MKLRNILITAAAVGFMFASADRTGVVGYTAGDYDDMNTYAHKAAGKMLPLHQVIALKLYGLMVALLGVLQVVILLN